MAAPTTTARVSYVPILVSPQARLGFSRCTVLAGVSVEPMPAFVHELFNKHLAFRPPFAPNCVIRVDHEGYRAELLARLRAEGKRLDDASHADPQPRDIARGVLVTLALSQQLEIAVDGRYTFDVERRGKRVHYRPAGYIADQFERTSFLISACLPPSASGKVNLRALAKLNSLVEKYYRPTYWRVDRIAQALHYFGTALFTPYSDQAFLALCTLLEALLSTTTTEVTHVLSERTARLLSKEPNERIRLYGVVKALYNVRSKVVHGDVRTPKGMLNYETLFVSAKRANVPVSSLRALADLAVKVLTANILDDGLRSILQRDQKEDQIRKALNDFYLTLR